MRLFKKKAIEERIEKIDDDLLYSPVKGTVKALSEIDDDAFSSGVLGKGIAVQPLDDVIVAPLSGKVATVFPTKHVVCIHGNNGCELLIHIGIDTVKLKGRYFDIKVTEGQVIEAGTLIGTVQFGKLKENGYKTDVILVVTNPETYKAEGAFKGKLIDKKEVLLNISKKEK